MDAGIGIKNREPYVNAWQVPLADLFNHKASVVGDEYAVIEEDNGGQSGESSSEGGEEVEMTEAVGTCWVCVCACSYFFFSDVCSRGRWLTEREEE